MVVDSDGDSRSAGRADLFRSEERALAHHITEERSLAGHGQVHATLDGNALATRAEDVVERISILRSGIAREREAAGSGRHRAARRRLQKSAPTEARPGDLVPVSRLLHRDTSFRVIATSRATAARMIPTFGEP